MEEIPFPDLKIDQTDFLDNLAGRSKCQKCGKSRKYYCYTCYVPVQEIVDRVPKIKLPIKVDIIKHPSECDGKSTAVHARVICPEDVTILTYPCIPDYNTEKTLLVFPGEKSVSLEELAEKLHICKPLSESCARTHRNTILTTEDCSLAASENGASVCSVNNERDTSTDSDSLINGFEAKQLTCDTVSSAAVNSETQNSVGKSDFSKLDDQEVIKVQRNSQEDQVKNTIIDHTDTEILARSHNVASKLGDSLSCFDKVVFVDSTWNQTRSICNDERLKGLTCVELKTRKTKFWRHQDDVPDTYLSTVEAIYYFMREFHETFMNTNYKGEYDNILFFFTFMYRKIRTIYDGGNELRAYKKRKVTHT